MEFNDKSVLNATMHINHSGLFVEITDKNGNTFSMSEIPDECLIIILKQKGYKVVKEF